MRGRSTRDEAGDRVSVGVGDSGIVWDSDIEVDFERAEGVAGTLDLRRWSRVWARVDWPVEAGRVLVDG